ncbi:ferritin-like domain-containing protein [Anoxybacter fermentans]|uniref:ferritin-like domain-containing protein n=1 Tax=Anoxybacter fermentans TaxID=1323375 RepID=UPI00196B603A|nr:ferritin family protein [Anoxybacter fermentans]
MGANPTDRCPFCGAAGKNLVPAAEWIDYVGLKISERSRALLKKALSLEIDNASFYKACAKAAETQITQAIFKRLSKQELEHAEVFADLLRIEEPEISEVEAPEADAYKFTEAHRREHRAIKYYLQAAREAREPRVQEVFRALSEVESEHLIISNMYK